MFVKPNSGLKVRDPETKGFLPAEGREVPPSMYWVRRLRDHDVVEVTAAQVAAAAAAKAVAFSEPTATTEEAAK